MWKYKDTYFLDGWSGASLIFSLFAAVCICFCMIAAGIQGDKQPSAWIVVLPLLVLVIGSGLAVYLARRGKREDSAELAEATPVIWQRLPSDSEIICRMQKKYKEHFCLAVFGFILLLLLSILMLFRHGMDREMLGFCASIFLCGVLFLSGKGVCWMFWLHPPVSLEFTCIPVAYSSFQTYKMRGGWKKDVKLFFFLPDGRYRVVLHQQPLEMKPPDNICFARWHGVVRWLY